MDNFKVGGAEKATMYAAGGAFFLSLVIGLAARNPFGIAFARAFFLSLLFGGILYGSIYVLRRFVPEIESLSAGTGRVPARNAAKESWGPQAKEPEVPLGESGQVVDLSVAEDLKETLRMPPGSQPVTGRAAGPQAVASAGGEPPELGLPAQAERPEKAGGEELEEALPSLDSLFEEERGARQVEDEYRSRATESKKTQDGFITIGNTRMRLEPEVMAKAVKRMMKKAIKVTIPTAIP